MLRILALALLGIVAWSAVSAPCRAETKQARRVALVIGNSAYKNTAALANPRHDAEALAAALTRLGFEVVTAFDVTQTQMADPVRKFVSRLQGADVALLFYAGHGLSFEGENYIVPVDTKAKDSIDIRLGMHKIRTITDEMARWSHVNIVMLDACRNNPLVRSLNRSLGGGGRSSRIGVGLSRIEQVGGQSFVMLATKDGEVAADGPRGRHSPFSQALLNNIETKGLDISGLARNVRKEVRSATNDRQVPLAIGSLDDAFYFLPPGKDTSTTGTATSKPALRDRTDERKRDQLYWESIKDYNSPEMFRSYIERFPDGVFVDIAKARLEELARTSKPSDKTTNETPPTSAIDTADQAYRNAVSDGSEAQLRAFVEAYPNHPKAADLKLMLDERDSWRKAERSNTREAYERYLLMFPKGLYAAAARERITALASREVESPSSSG